MFVQNRTIDFGTKSIQTQPGTALETPSYKLIYSFTNVHSSSILESYRLQVRRSMLLKSRVGELLPPERELFE